MTVPPYRLFDRGPDVAEYFSSVSGEPVLALDLEADSLHL